MHNYPLFSRHWSPDLASTGFVTRGSRYRPSIRPVPCPAIKESGIDWVEFSSNFKPALRHKDGGSYLGNAIVAEMRQATGLTIGPGLVSGALQPMGDILGNAVCCPSVMRSHSRKGAHCQILVVEDDPYDAELTEAFLKVHLECHVTRATTRAEFEKALERHKPDLILSDSCLPAFDGFAALAIATQKCPGVPFVFCTGDKSPTNKAEALVRGAKDYVHKDDALGLIAVIERLCADMERQSNSADEP